MSLFAGVDESSRLVVSQNPNVNAELVKTVIDDTFLPVLYDIFSRFEDGDFSELPDRDANSKQLFFLDQQLKDPANRARYNRQIIPLSPKGDRNQIYQLRVEPRLAFNIYLDINSVGMQIRFSKTEENDENVTQISFGLDRVLNMYKYGVKNGDIKISGNSLNTFTFNICRAMKISQLYIGDNARIPCNYDATETIEHFSILRVICGKNTFYQTFPGHFLDTDAAAAEITMLRLPEAEGGLITDSERALMMQYMDSLKTVNTLSKSESNLKCREINDIIERIYRMFGNGKPAILQYIATPYEEGRGGYKKHIRRSRNRKRRSRRYSRKRSKRYSRRSKK
jgi:hypothetical protein